MTLAAQRMISIRGAREHNLRDLSLDIPRASLIVVTGPSGSGKSSLAFDTLYAEGQRRYVETLSAYARQFLADLPRPDVDSIEGLSPSVSIDQRRTGATARSTVGTMTETYDFMRLLWARCGTAFCPACGVPIEALAPTAIVERVLAAHAGRRVAVLAPLVEGRKGEHRDVLDRARRAGFARLRIDGREVETGAAPARLPKTLRHSIAAVVDRLVPRAEARPRLLEAVEAAVALSNGPVAIEPDGASAETFSTVLGCPRCGRGVPDLHPRRFSFNSPMGACPACDGLGVVEGLSADSLIDPEAPLERAVRGIDLKRDRFTAGLLRSAARWLGVDPSAPWGRLPEASRRTLLHGGPVGEAEFPGLLKLLGDRLARGVPAARLRKHLAPVPCGACGGRRLRPEALAVRLAGRSIDEIAALDVDSAAAFFDGLDLGGEGRRGRDLVAAPILREIRPRLAFLRDVGLGYLSLDRPAPTLSGGEAQRVRLAAALGAHLSGVLYVLDEPTIGLHPADTDRLLATLRALARRGNTVVVVEHDERTMRAADHLIDLGPGAGPGGGRILDAGPPAGVGEVGGSVTADFLSGRRRVEVPRRRRSARGALRLLGASGRNLRDVDLEVPFGAITCIVGVSGSGKSTLVADTLVPAVARALGLDRPPPLPFRALEGVEGLGRLVEVTQEPIGRTPRSNPATYIGIFGAIRSLYAETPEARMRGWGPGRFSFNVEGGRCARCEGDGAVKVEMHFLPDVFVRCETCGGTRYARETLEVLYKGRTIAEVLEMTVEEALRHFAAVPAVATRLRLLAEVGLGYLRLGQSATTLSGGEAQRIKLVAELARRPDRPEDEAGGAEETPSSTSRRPKGRRAAAAARAGRRSGRTLYCLDEPTTGLHFTEVERLLGVLGRLADRGDPVVVVEHHPDVVAAADRVVEIGPGPGAAGGRLSVVR